MRTAPIASFTPMEEGMPETVTKSRYMMDMTNAPYPEKHRSFLILK